MCLKSKMTNAEKNEITSVIGKDGITVYKAVGVVRGKYYPLCFGTRKPYGVGIIEADTSAIIAVGSDWETYKSGFHFFVHKKEAQEALRMLKKRIKDPDKKFAVMKKQLKSRGEIFRKEHKLIECIVKKSWITAAGLDCGNLKTTTIVAKKAIFPDPKEK